MLVRDDREGIAVIRLEHGKVNALDLALLREVRDTFAGLRGAAPAGVVLTGTGRNFSAGLDLTRLAQGDTGYLRDLLPLLHEMILEIFTFPRPVVAAVNGHAIAGGFVLACTCDYRVVAEEGARLGVTELPVGVPFPAAPLEMVRTVLGTGPAREIVYGGRLFEGREAARIGFADELAPPPKVVERAVEVAATWGAMAPAAFALTKEQLHAPTVARLRAEGPTIDAGIAKVWNDPATHEAIRAFIARTLGSG